MRILYGYCMDLIENYRQAALAEIEKCRAGALVNDLIRPPIIVIHLSFIRFRA